MFHDFDILETEHHYYYVIKKALPLSSPRHSGTVRDESSEIKRKRRLILLRLFTRCCRSTLEPPRSVIETLSSYGTWPSKSKFVYVSFKQAGCPPTIPKSNVAPNHQLSSCSPNVDDKCNDSLSYASLKIPSMRGLQLLIFGNGGFRS